jgi:hypothetical protein
MLIVQAQVEGVPIASNETIFDDYGIARLWPSAWRSAR